MKKRLAKPSKSAVKGSSLSLILCSISFWVTSGCVKHLCENKRLEQIVEQETASAMYVAHGAEDIEGPPLIAAFAGDIPIRVAYYIGNDGTCIWSKQWDGDPPYYRAKISANKMSQLKEDLQFLETVNAQVRFNWSVRPGGFAVLTIFDMGVLLNITASDRFTGVGGYLPLENEQVDRLIETLQKDSSFSEKEAQNYADSLWSYIMQLLETYIPDEGKIVEDMSYEVRSVPYSYPVQR
jgi:hypothetical protein